MAKTVEGYLWTNEKSRRGLHTDAVLPSTDPLADDYDVCIIGAGFAGLTAARDLSIKGYRVVVVEARDRIGGRTWTAKEQGEEFEMGGTWIHWTQPHVYREISRYGLERKIKSSNGTAAAEQILWKPAQGHIKSLDVAERTSILEDLAVRAFSLDGLSSSELMPYPHDPLREPALWKKYDSMSWKARLDMMTEESQFVRDLLETEFNTTGAATGHEISFVEASRWYALGGHTMEGTFAMAGTFKIGGGGMTALARAMLQEAKSNISMGTVVKLIKQNETGVVVTTEEGRIFRASSCICTIPLNVLKSITFDPPLPSLQTEAIALGHINHGTKFHFQVAQKQPAWFATADCSSPSPFCFGFTDHHGTPGNKTFAIGFGYNDRIPDLTDSKKVLAGFKDNIQPNAEVEAYLSHDWANDPFAKGTWSCWGPGMMSKYLCALQERCGRIFMASADWANGYRGFVDGAIEQGAKAAREVEALLCGKDAPVQRSKL